LAVEAGGGTDDGVDEIPQFRLFEVLVLHLLAVVDLVGEKIRVVFVLELD
jgi:hypothetical protein